MAGGVVAFENERHYLFIDRPLAVHPDQWSELKRLSEYVFQLANDTLIKIINSENIPDWIIARNNALRSHWVNKKQGINIMRIDFCWDQNHNFRVMELNTACPGGWIASEKVSKILHVDRFGTSLAPESMFFSKYLMKKLGSCIIILTLGSDYTNELQMMSDEITLLGGKCFIIDPLKVSIPEIAQHNPTGFYWKSDPLRMLRHPQVLDELATLRVPQISSLEAQLVTEDKSILGILKAKDETGSILPTYNLSKEDISINLSFFQQNSSVLKASNLSRGVKILFGKDYDPDTWKSLIENAMEDDYTWILQEAGVLRKTRDGKYGDIAVFLADGVAIGALSRVSDSMVTNVGKNGALQPVVITENLQDDRMDKIPAKKESSIL